MCINTFFQFLSGGKITLIQSPLIYICALCVLRKSPELLLSGVYPYIGFAHAGSMQSECFVLA